jgi:DUF1365 family protein
MISALYRGEVMHRRLRPRAHRLRYRLFSLYLDLGELDGLSIRLRLLARNRFAPLAFYDRDHLAGTDEPLRAQIARMLAHAGIAWDGGAIRVLTMPRLLGFVFNPLSVWFCHRHDGGLAGVVYEVNNTFGERHCYALPAAGEGAVRQDCAKAFHVSPFLPMALDYAFRVAPPGERLALGITASDCDGPVLTAVHTARRRALSDAQLARALVAYPLLTLKVVAGILWEAARLWAKRVPIFRHPQRGLHPAE